MSKKNPSEVRPGDELYIDSSWYIEQGERDVCGGIAIVKNVERHQVRMKVNQWFVTLKGIEGHIYNLTILLERQAELEEEFGDRIAHNCPDVPGAKCPNPIRISRESVLKVSAKEKNTQRCI
jgi:hypothetical protein